MSQRAGRCHKRAWDGKPGKRRREASSRSPGNGHISRVGRRDGSVRATAGGRSPAPFAGRLRPCTWRGSGDSDVGVPRCATPSAIAHRYVTGRWPAAPGLRGAGGSVSRDRSRTALDASRSARSSSQIASSLAASADSRRGSGRLVEPGLVLLLQVAQRAHRQRAGAPGGRAACGIGGLGLARCALAALAAAVRNAIGY